MKPKSSPLFLLTILAAVILVSGCTGLDPTTLAKSNSMIQQFLNEHPNAQIKVTHFTAEQAKNIIDQIRSDCDNPYLDEKEFYRVNITDTETNFFAIVWIDWNTKTVECVFKIGTEGKVVEKPKIKPECESHSYYKCDSGNLYWFDSCGNKQEKKEYCQYGCSEKACLGDCKSQAEYRCYGDHVYWFDSCGNKQEKKEYCQYGCENGFCKPKTYEKTCEEAGGYCIWPQGYCGDGVCSESEREYVCPQDCGVVPSSGGGGSSESEGQAICEKKCATSDIKFADFRADKETYSTGEVLRFFAKIIDNNGNPAAPEQGISVYLFAISPTGGPVGGPSIPINYNYSTGYYDYATTPIPANIDSGTWAFFATAEKNESFATSGNAYVKINSTASSASPSASPVPYEGCMGKCLLRFRLADFTVLKSLTIAKQTATGMVVAMEVTATSTRVTYQCREGYEIGKHFCKEGGICCIPRTATCGNGVCELGEATECPEYQSYPPQAGQCRIGTCPQDCETPSTEFCGSSTQGPCASDSECITGGCSGQVCQSIKEQSVPTTCEYKDCYNAEKYGMKCRCIHESITPAATAAIIGESSIQGKCKWVKAETIGYCKDSDGGKNYHVKGIVTGNDVDGGSLQLNDVCEGNYVHEYFCQEPNPNGNYIERQNYGWVNYPCPNGCKEGVCVKETPTCSDSTGTHKFGESWTAPDGCNTCYCKENGYITCTNIACTTCTDSDGGLDYYTKGSTLLKENGIPGASGSDFCTGVGNDLMEYVCQGNTYTGIKYNCPHGCYDGACLQQNQNCTDSDGGRYDYYTKGTITYQQGSFADFCVSPTLLTENYCDYSYYPLYQGRADSYNCTNGCLDGACIQQQNQTYTCTSYYDQACPASCAAGSDADCCSNAGKYWLQTNSGYGCYDTNYNTGCSAGKPCSNTSDQCCPNWCAAGSDIDCCTQAQKCWIENGCYTCQ